MTYDLSILIPARNEAYLAKTVEGILENIEGNTEIIVLLDGQWADPGIPQHERVTIIYYPESIGQRAGTNQACKLSSAKYVMKCDAHVAFGKGFDRILMENMQDDWTVVPKMYNLHVFDWSCKKCGNRWYQGPTPTKCQKAINGDPKAESTNRTKAVENPDCDNTTDFERIIVFKPNSSPETTSMRFDSSLHFQYFNEYRKKQEGDLVETMSLLGACFMLTREKYWELDICDENHGSWGQQGTEVACKTWLSGGKLICNKKTWFAHLFRTQGGDFGFPYPNTSISQARAYSRKLWLENGWPKAKYPLSWLVDKFSPVPGWIHGSKGILYYTDSQLDEKIANQCREQIKKGAGENRIVSVSLKQLTGFGDNITLSLERGYLTMFKQILAGLEALDTDIVFFCEHDVLYHPSHFDFVPPRKDVYYYNTNVWKLNAKDGHAVRVDDCRQLSGLCAHRDLLLQHYRERVRRVEAEGFSRKMGFEPGTHNRQERVDDFKSEAWVSRFPNVDIRHDTNLTPSRWNKDQFRDQRYTKGWQEADEIPGWGKGIHILI